MSNTNSKPLSPSVKQSVITYISSHFAFQLSKLYPGIGIEKLIQPLSDETLTGLALEETPFHELVKMLPPPEIKSLYWHILEKHPHLPELYPQTDIYSLPQNQLERLATETNPIPILGQPSSESCILLQQPENPMDPPKKKSSVRRSGNPKTTSLGKYRGVSAKRE